MTYIVIYSILIKSCFIYKSQKQQGGKLNVGGQLPLLAA